MEWERKNKHKRRAYTNHSKSLKRAFIKKIKARPCESCGEQYKHYNMEYAHVAGADKKATLSQMHNNNSWKEILDEINKCLILCTICHRDYDYENIR